jgi:hypothetical protein
VFFCFVSQKITNTAEASALELCSSYVDIGRENVSSVPSCSVAAPYFFFNETVFSPDSDWYCQAPYGFLSAIQDEFVCQISVPKGTSASLVLDLLIVQVRCFFHFCF